METSKWDRRFLALAEHISAWSKDPSMKVGAVIANGNRIISLGYNGFPAGVIDSEDRYNDRDIKLAGVLHAEKNAILFAKQDLSGYTIYTWPTGPCANCASMIIQSGIKHIVCPSYIPDRWKPNIELGKEFCKEAGVSYLEV